MISWDPNTTSSGCVQHLSPLLPFSSLYLISYMVPGLGLRDRVKRQIFSIPIVPHAHLQIGRLRPPSVGWII